MNKEFWIAALKRAIHTAAQTAIGIIGAHTLFAEVNWPIVASAAGMAAVVSLLKSIAIGVPEVEIDDQPIR